MTYIIIKTNCEKGIENITTEILSVHEEKDEAYGKLNEYIIDCKHFCYKFHSDGLIKTIKKGFFVNGINHYLEILKVPGSND